MLKKHNLTQCISLLCTHGHIDHVCGLSAAQNITKAPIVIHSADEQLYNIAPLQAMLFGSQLASLPPVTRRIEEFDRISVGEFDAVVKHTPGHSPGSVCFDFEDVGVMATGDTLFFGSVGNSMLPGGDQVALKASVLKLLDTTDPKTVVLPGHGGVTTIGAEKSSNLIYYL
ncbi:Beta lactamase domain [Entamoeba marina]